MVRGVCCKTRQPGHVHEGEYAERTDPGANESGVVEQYVEGIERNSVDTQKASEVARPAENPP